MDPFQQFPFPPPLSLVLLLLVAVFVGVLVTFIATKQHYQDSTLTITTTNLQVEKNTTAQQPQSEQRLRLSQEPLPAELGGQEQPRAQPIPIRAPHNISPVAWRNSFGPNMLPPRTRTSLSSSLGARKGSCARCSWSSSDGDTGSGSEGSAAGSVGSREMFFGNMGTQF